jgi:hypothetical protein
MKDLQMNLQLERLAPLALIPFPKNKPSMRKIPQPSSRKYLLNGAQTVRKKESGPPQTRQCRHA